MSDAPAEWISGNRWQLKPSDNAYALAVSQRHGLAESIGHLLNQREVPLDKVPDYLSPSLKSLLPEPNHLLGMEEAVAAIKQAIGSGKVIGVFGDYDVDGATSSAILLRYFKACGAQAVVHIPDRQKEGYGPNLHGFAKLREQGAELIITVDTGALAHEVLGQAAEQGYQVIVLDHHQGEPQLPKSVAVVNPNRFDETTDYRYLAAVGVTFLTLVALNRALRDGGYFKEHKEPDLRQLLDIVALGAVCDVVPLIGLNRAFVKQGLKIMAAKQNLGITALMEVGRVEELPSPYHLGFIIGPRINAGGRVGQADLGVQLLACDDPTKAKEIAEQLDHYNQERRAIEARVQQEATAQAEAQVAAGEQTMLFAVGENWHEGVIGIVAGRIKEKFSLPVAVISINTDKCSVGKASARSVSGVDMGQMVIAARQAGLLEAGGGHAMAAGFSISADKRDEFIAFARDYLKQSVTDYQENYVSEYAAVLPITAATVEFCDQLEAIGPFGAGNAAPRFRFDNLQIVKADIIGKTQEHLRIILAEPSSTIGRTTLSLKSMSFGTAQEPFGQQILNAKGKIVSVIGRLKREEWQGRVSVTLMLEDVLIA
jgi:single-stranded-DNA-specific exonuclease